MKIVSIEYDEELIEFWEGDGGVSQELTDFEVCSLDFDDYIKELCEDHRQLEA